MSPQESYPPPESASPRVAAEPLDVKLDFGAGQTVVSLTRGGVVFVFAGGTTLPEALRNLAHNIEATAVRAWCALEEAPDE